MKKINFLFFVILLGALSAVAQPVLKQSMYIDFGKPDAGMVTTDPDANTHYWNNVTSGAVANTSTDLVNSENEATNYKLQIIKKFSINSDGGLGTPDENLLGDLAVETATKDYFFCEGGANVTSAFKIKGLNPQKAYKFYIFGSRSNTQERIARFTFYGLMISSGTQQTSGTDMEGAGINQNTSTILTSENVFPDSNGEIIIEMAREAGSYSHINALKIEEYEDVEYPPYQLDNKLYFDFGHTNTITSSPDVNDNYWNNITSGTAGAAFAGLITSDNTATTYELEISRKFTLNDSSPGGLEVFDSETLGEFGIATAIRDYIFTDANNGQIKIKNLDRKKGYKFYLFGSRSDANNRIAEYKFTGLNLYSGTHQTSGSGIGATADENAVNQNNTSTFITDFIYPDENGEITLEVIRNIGSYAHLNCMKMEEYSIVGGIKAESVTVTGDDITESGKIGILSAVVSPSNATYPPVIWSVDNEDIAWIDSSGRLYPKSNGSVNVTATIKYDEEDKITGSKTINIGNQLDELYLAGSASEKGAEVANAIRMNRVTSKAGEVSNLFEVFTSLSEGTFNFYTTNDAATTIVYGGTLSNLDTGGAAIDAGVTGTVRIYVDLNENTCTILPVTLNITGSATPNGWSSTGGINMTYRGEGVWSDQITLNGGTTTDRARLNILLDKTWDNKVLKVKGVDNAIMLQAVADKYGIVLEDMNTAISGGVFDIVVNLSNYTYSIECVDVNHYKISMMGSSVANGQGATEMKGYAYMYGTLLAERYSAELSAYDWKVSGASINGNNTTDALNRWNSDMIGDCSGYVIYGLSLGNEGIHDNGQTAYNSYNDNMQLLIQKAREAGKIPVVCNNYTRTDFNATDYDFIKKMNISMHQWDVPSINMLGAIDNGSGQWATGYQVEGDIYHPTTDGHREFFYAMVPSLFDALEAGKAQPVRNTGTSYSLEKTARIEFTPEATIHPFTLSFGFKTSGTGIIADFTNATATGSLRIDTDGKLIYTSPLTGNISSDIVVNDNQWYQVTLTHYYAQGRTILYVNNTKAGELNEKLTAGMFGLGNSIAPEEIDFRELLFYRSAMSEDEVAALNDAKMLKSSLEIYAPLGESTEPFANLAQSTNTLQYKPAVIVGVDSNPESGKLAVYPNPAVHQITLNGLSGDNSYVYSILGVDGKILQSGILNNGKNQLNVSNLQPAYYILKVENPALQEAFCVSFIKSN